jgi:hypothetical protein
MDFMPNYAPKTNFNALELHTPNITLAATFIGPVGTNDLGVPLLGELSTCPPPDQPITRVVFSARGKLAAVHQTLNSDKGAGVRDLLFDRSRGLSYPQSAHRRLGLRELEHLQRGCAKRARRILGPRTTDGVTAMGIVLGEIPLFDVDEPADPVRGQPSSLAIQALTRRALSQRMANMQTPLKRKEAAVGKLIRQANDAHGSRGASYAILQAFRVGLFTTGQNIETSEQVGLDKNTEAA